MPRYRGNGGFGGKGVRTKRYFVKFTRMGQRGRYPYISCMIRRDRVCPVRLNDIWKSHGKVNNYVVRPYTDHKGSVGTVFLPSATRKQNRDRLKFCERLR